MSRDTSDSTSELLAVVEASPAAVAAHDREAWSALFTGDGVVEDPVGSRPRAGREELSAFWDAFIAPNTITFDVHHDEVWPTAGGGTVVRDVDLSTRIGAAGPAIVTPAHLRYDLVRTDRGPCIGALRAHWSQPALTARLLRARGGPSAGLAMTRGVLSALGAGGALGFARGSLRPALVHRPRVERMLTALGRGESGAAARFLDHGRAIDGAGEELDARALVRVFAGTRVGQVIVAGDTVTASVHRVVDASVGRTPVGGRGVVEYRIPRGGGGAELTVFLRS